MEEVSPGAPPMGFVASETSRCNELEMSAEHCSQTGQLLVINSDKALSVAKELHGRLPTLRIRADVGAWRRADATAESPLADVDNLFGLAGWYEQHFPAEGAIDGYTPSRFLRANNREARQALLEQTAEVPSNIVTRIAIEASVLDAARRDEFFDDLAQTPKRRFAFAFADERDPVAKYQRLDGLRCLLQEHPGCEIDHVDPLVAADALAHGASWVGVGASGARRMPMRPRDKGGPTAAGFLPGLFLEDLLELRSPMIYADWYANARSPFCVSCGRSLDVFEPTVSDKAVIVGHNLHQTTSHIGDLWAQSPEERQGWLREKRLQAHARHMDLNPLGSMPLNRNLHRFLELDDPELRSMTRAGAWT